jgi:hypothetical protein
LQRGEVAVKRSGEEEVREDEGGWRAGTLVHRRAVSGRGGIGCG